jgi:hypothetical protein
LKERKTMKNALKNYNDYLAGRERIKAEFENELIFVRNNYTGEFLKQKEAELKGNYTSKLNKLQENHVQAMNSEFDRAVTRMKSVVMKPIPDDTLKMLKSLDGMKLTDLEKEELFKLTEGNYMARRRALDMLGDDFIGYDILGSAPSSLDMVMNKVEELKTAMNKTLMSEAGDFLTAVIQNGDWVNNVESEVNSFLQAYE